MDSGENFTSDPSPAESTPLPAPPPPLPSPTGTGVSCSNASGVPRAVVLPLAGNFLCLHRLKLHGNGIHGSLPAQVFNATSLHTFSDQIHPTLCNLPRFRLGFRLGRRDGGLKNRDYGEEGSWLEKEA